MNARAHVVLLFLSAFAGAASGGEIAVRATTRCDFPLAAIRAADLDGDGRDEIVAVGVAGEVRVWRQKGAGLIVLSTMQLPDPRHSLLAISDVLGIGKDQLAVLSPKGLRVHGVTAKGGFDTEGKTVAARAKFKIRVGQPRFAWILRDVNGDGRPDLTVPAGENCEVWLSGGKPVRFRKAATVHVEMSHWRTVSGVKLSDELDSAFRIPNLDFTDVNGDDRPDLVVEDDQTRAFHLQREDGEVPSEPDVRLDLNIFRDTTPSASIRPGRTLAGGGKARLQMTDLDQDGILDYVIAHRRKVWVFHGSRTGPEFKNPSAILRVAEDVTALVVSPLNDDEYPDLLLIRVQVPTIAAVLQGLFAESEVEIDATGYASEKGKGFERKPTWKGTLIVRLPEILGVLRNPDAIIKRFEETAQKFRTSVTGDLDGDGKPDVAMISPDSTVLEVWYGLAEVRRSGSELRYFFFEEPDRVWSLERILTWLGGEAERKVARMTGNRSPDAKVELRDPAKFGIEGIHAADLDGDGRRDLVVVYSDDGQGGAVIDVLAGK